MIVFDEKEKIYKYTGKGVTLSSTVLAIAGSRKTAASEIYESLKSDGLTDNLTVKEIETSLVEYEIPKQASVIYYDSGEY